MRPFARSAHIHRFGTIVVPASAALLVTATAAQAATPPQLVTRTLVSSNDVPAGYRVAPPQVDWDKKPTVNGCGAKPTSERFRRVRDARTVLTANQTSTKPSAGQQVVSYDTAAHAALAMKELRAGLAACPTKRGITFFGTTITITTTRAVVDPSLPVKDNLVFKFVVTITGHSPRPPTFGLVTVQRQGQILNLISASGPGTDKARVLRNTMRIVRNTGMRQLAAL